MKKDNTLCDASCNSPNIEPTRARFRFISKLIGVFVLLACLAAGIRGYSQHITLAERNKSLGKIFPQIKQQSGYTFWYEDKLLKNVEPVSINIQNATLEQTLDNLFAATSLTYEIVGRTVAIKEKEKEKESIPLVEAVAPVTITGKVTTRDGSPLPGVTVVIKGTTKGAITDSDGNFTLQATTDDKVLIFSSIGMKKQEVEIKGRTKFEVVMEEEVSALQEVVVTGYQTLPKERVTGSFSKVDTKELERTLSYNIEDKLTNGTLNGLLADPATGISIRGVATLNASRLPLVIVDGFPIQVDINQNPDAEDAVDFDNLSRALNSINPNDVESITLLKDAAAMSIYGARAANGVIVIVMKKTGGKISEPEVNFSTNLSFKPKPDVGKLPFANPATYFWIEQSRYNAGWYTNNGATSIDPSYTNLPDYYYVRARVRDGILPPGDLTALEEQMKTYDNRNEFSDYFLRKSTHQQYNISVNQRAGFNNYRFSLGYDKDMSSSKNDNDNRIVANFSNISKPLKWLVITTGLNLALRNEENNGLTLNDLFTLPQHQRILDENGNYTSMSAMGLSGGGKWYRDYMAANYSYVPYDWKWNIKQEFDNKDNTVKSVSTRMQGGIQVKPFGEVLTLDVKYQYEFGSLKQKNYYNENTYYVRNLVNTYAQPTLLPVPKGGILEHQYGTNYSHDFIATAIFNKTFAKKHTFVMLAGTEVREQNTDRSNVRRYGYDPQTLAYVYQLDFKTQFPRNLVYNASPYYIDPSAAWSTIYNFYVNTDRFISAFGNAAYNFSDKYDLTGSWRLDQSNMFGQSPKYRQVPLWSVGVGWTINKESFFQVPFIDRLRLRATYGSSGNVDKSTSPYAIAAIGGSYTNSQLGLPGAKYTNPANPELRWEKTKQINIGLEFAILKDRIDGSIDYYYKKSSDLLATQNINSTYGFSSAKFNIGKMSNRGIDVDLSFLAIRTSKFSWRSQLLFSFNLNEVLKTDKEVAINNTSFTTALMYQQYRVVTGRPRFNLVAMKTGPLDNTGYPQFYYQDSLYKWTTPTYPIYSSYTFAMLHYEGTTIAPYYGSWNNVVAYKGFELSCLLSYKFGHVYQHKAPFVVSNNDLFGIAQGNYIPHYSKEFENMWKKPGDENITDIPTLPFQLNGAQVRAGTVWYTYPVNYGTQQTQNAALVRVQRISLAYSLNKAILPKMVSRLTFMVQGRNLGIFTFNKYHEDPEYLPDMQGTYLLATSPEYAFSIMATF